MTPLQSSVPTGQLVIKDRPPNYTLIREVFPLAAGPGVVFAYAPNIYNPSGNPLPPELIAHEMAHIERQEAIGVDAWWDKYLADPEFRYIEELIAHRAEYLNLIARYETRQLRRQALKYVAKKLCAPLYGRMRSIEQAKKDILNVGA